MTYNCAEQFMMAGKAKLFGDEEIRQQILDSKDPKTQKMLGRAVRGFDEDKWNEAAKEIVFQGNMAKFSQNEDLKEKLIATKNKILVETSPYDKVWGVGLRQTDPKATNPRLWKGKNWLGEVLTRVRESIK